MSFIVRNANIDDLESLLILSKQFTLLNLPAEKNILKKKLELSEKSFLGNVNKDEALYIFVAEELESKKIVGSSQLVAKKGTERNPSYSFKVSKKENFSQSLGVGFIHQILSFTINKNGSTELGGLVVDRNFRNHPQKVGKLISLSRFLYLKHRPERFQDNIHAEMAPPLNVDGKSEFWEALGRRFTGMPYQEADQLSYQNKEFIESLFPKEDIYLCLLDAKARLVLGQVSEETVPALKMLEKIGFYYKQEVDPFDGGPHIGARVDDLRIINESKILNARKRVGENFSGTALVSTMEKENFRCCMTSFSLDENNIVLPDITCNSLQLKQESKVLFFKLF
jgi:arginine N-succinyltransferase